MNSLSRIISHKALLEISVFIFFLIQSAAFSQEKKNNEKSEFDIYSYKPEPKDRLILELNHTGWLNTPKGVKGKLTSGGVNFLLYFDYPIGKSKFSFAWGAGISSHNVHGKFDLIYKIDSVSGLVNYSSLEPRELDYKKNRYGMKIIEVPFEFRFRTHTRYQLKIMTGVKVGYVVQSFRKLFDDYGKVKTYDLYGINQLRYGVQFRIGVEQVHLTCFYALSELFEKGKGNPGITPYSIGIAWTPRISLGSGSSRQQL